MRGLALLQLICWVPWTAALALVALPFVSDRGARIGLRLLAFTTLGLLIGIGRAMDRPALLSLRVEGPWLPDWGAAFVLGVDAGGLVLLFGVAVAVALAATLDRTATRHLTILRCVQLGAALGAITAREPVLFSTFALVVLGTPLAIGTLEPDPRRAAAWAARGRRGLTAGSLLLAASAYASTAVPGSLRAELQSAVLAALLGAWLLVVPWVASRHRASQRRLGAVSDALDLAVSTLVLWQATLLLGSRYAPQALAQHGALLATGFVTWAVVSGASAWRRADQDDRLRDHLRVVLCLAIAGAFVADTAGTSGGLVLAATLLGTLPAWQGIPRGRASLLAILVAVAAPGTIAFVAARDLVEALAQHGALLGAAAVIAWVASVTAALAPRLAELERPSAPPASTSLRWRGAILVVLLLQVGAWWSRERWRPSVRESCSRSVEPAALARAALEDADR